MEIFRGSELSSGHFNALNDLGLIVVAYSDEIFVPRQVESERETSFRFSRLGMNRSTALLSALLKFVEQSRYVAEPIYACLPLTFNGIENFRPDFSS